jgi:hypothetical protein
METSSNTDDHPRCEVADIFRRYGEEYRSQNGMTKKQHAVMSAIAGCRTSDYGFHVDQCDTCGNTETRFNSCRDRHCPKCQGISRHKWVNSRLKNTLPLSYYHVVFTLPHFLNPLTRYNKRLVYDLLLSSSSETLLAFGRDPKWLGGEIGFYGILHTWGQKLWLHPHVHFIVAGGALTAEGCWKEPASGEKFLFPVKALSMVFRGKFIEGLKRAYSQDKIDVPPDLSELNRPELFERWVDDLVSRDWVVYCKPPFSDPERVIRYIGRYTHRVAVSNRRIIGVKNGRVHFWYKEYGSDRITWRKMSLECMEFIRRFLLHVLPEGFHKIRHYGFLANGRCKCKLAFIRELLRIDPPAEEHSSEAFRQKCPICRVGMLIPVRLINRWGKNLAVFVAGPLPGYLFNTS